MHECSVGGYWGQGEMEAGSPLWLPLKRAAERRLNNT